MPTHYLYVVFNKTYNIKIIYILQFSKPVKYNKKGGSGSVYSMCCHVVIIITVSLLLLVYLYCKRLELVKPLQSFPRKSSQTTRTKQTASWGVPVSVICDWLVLHGTFEKFNDGHTIEYIFDWLYFNKAYTSNNNYGHVIHFYWKIYNDNGTKGFVLEKKTNGLSW